jgi:signal recognition particle subunit SRP54
MPGMPGQPGARKQPARQQPKKKGGRGVSGNPARRNAQPAAHGAQPSEFNPAAAFGAGAEFDQEALEKAMAEFQLPPELRSRFSK